MDPHSFIARAEAQRWLGIAEKLLISHDLVGSKTFAIRARESDPRLEAAEQILAIADTLLAAEKRVVGNNGAHQPDYYAILQLVRFVEDADQIASQYRRLAVLLNPHQNRFPYSDQAFQLVNDAWGVLSNPMRKSMYDSDLDYTPQQQMNTLGFNLEQQHHQQQQPHNFFSINHMGGGHEQELPEQQQTFQSRLHQSHQHQNQHQHQQLQQHNFLSQPNPVRPLPVREQEHLFQHREQEQLFQSQVQPFQVTSPPHQTRPSPQPPQQQTHIQSPPETPQPPFSWAQTQQMSQQQKQQQQQSQLQQQFQHQQLKQEQQKQHQLQQEQLKQQQMQQEQLKQQKMQQEQLKQQQLQEEQRKQQQLQQEKLKQQQLMEEQRKQQQMMEEQRKQQQLMEEQRKQQQLMEEQRKQQQLMEEQRKKQLEEQRKQQLLMEEQRKQQLLMEEQRKQKLIEEQRKQQQLMEEQRKQQQLMEEQRKQQQMMEEQRKQQQLMEEQRKQQLMEEQRKQQQLLEEQRKQQLQEEQRKQQQLLEEQRKQQLLEEEKRKQQQLQEEQLKLQQLQEEQLKQQQLQQEQLKQQQLQESEKQNVTPLQPPSGGFNSNNGVREEEAETEAETEPVDDSPTFWTACPYCFYMYEYPKVYVECTLRCDNCKRAFQAVRISSPPPIIEGQDACFYCWGFIPVGLSMSDLQKNSSKGTNWTPFSSLHNASNNVQNHLNEQAAPKENLFVNKSSGPRIYIDDITDDVFLGVSDPSSDSDAEWDVTKKVQKQVQKPKQVNENFKERIQVLALRALDTRNQSSKNLNPVKEAVLVVETSKINAVKNRRKQSGRAAKERGKLDLNVEFNNNEGGDTATRVTNGTGGHVQGEDNIEGNGFFEGLDEYLSSLPILSVVKEEKVQVG